MRGRYLVAITAVAMVVPALWLWRTGGETRDTEGGGGAATGVATPARVSAGAVAWPGWFAAPAAAPRRVAGQVVAGGRPVVGATVRLRHALIAAGAMAAPVVETGADGRFDFGPQPRARVWLGVAAEGFTPRGLSLELADPTLDPGPEDLRVVLYRCAAWVRGQIADASGGPVVGAEVMIGEGDAVVSTDGDGHYRACVPEREIDMTVRAAGYATVRERVLVAGEVTRDFELAPAATIVGRVERIDDGGPVVGAQVSARLQSFGWASSSSGTTTGTDGRFSLEGLMPGRYQLEARDRATIMRGDPSAVARVGQVGAPVLIRMLPAYRVSGVAELDGAPAAGVSLAVGMSSGITDAGGRFELAPVAPGPQTLFVRGHELIEPAGSLEVAGDVELTVRLRARGGVRGRVLADGDPVEGAEVVARGRAYAGSDISGPDGAYRIEGLVPGPYEISATSLRVGAFSAGTEVEVAGGQVAEADAVLDLAASIAGRVVDAGDRPVAGVFVTATLQGGQDHGRGFTADDGRFELRGLSGGGLYELQVAPAPELEGGFPAAGGGTLEPVAVADGRSRVTAVVLRIDPATATIAGRVESASGAPVPDAVVKAYLKGARRHGGRWRDVTGADGIFTLAGLLPGAYPVVVHAPSGEQRVIETPVQTGTGDLVVVFEIAGTITGRLVGFTEEVEVLLSRRMSAGDIAARVAGDRFHAADLPPGHYEVEVRGRTQAATAAIEVASGQTAAIEVSNPGSLAVRGTVISFDTGEPLEGAVCGWATSSGMHLGAGAARADAAGRFDTRVPIGRRVTCLEVGHLVSSALPGADGDRVRLMAVPIRARDSSAGLALDDESGRLLVVSVAGGGPASAAGVREGDALETVGGRDVTMLGDYIAEKVIERHAPGTRLTVGLERDGDPLEVTLTLAAP